jgi:hypothetical protein
VDLAKLYEHHAGDLAAALALTRIVLARAEAELPPDTGILVTEALRHRARRLERRLGRR